MKDNLGSGFAHAYSRLGKALLFHGVPGAPVVPDDPGLWQDQAAWIVEWGLARIALRSADATGIDLPQGVRDVLAGAAKWEAVRSLSLEGASVEILDTLHRSGVDALLLKGPVLAARDPRLADRSYMDIDIMVAPESLASAAAALNGIGFEEPVVHWDPRSNFRYRYRHAVPFERGDVAIDLHHVLPPVVFGRRIDFRTLYEDSRRFRIGGLECRIASPVHAAIASALHVLSSRGGSWPKPWRDAAILLSASDAANLAEEAARRHLTTPVAAVAAALCVDFGLDIPLWKTLRSASSSAVDRFHLWSMSSSRPWIDHQLGEVVMLPAGLALRFAAAFVLPDKQFLRARYPRLAHRPTPLSRFVWWGSSAARLFAVARKQPLPPRIPEHRRHPDHSHAGSPGEGHIKA